MFSLYLIGSLSSQSISLRQVLSLLAMALSAGPDQCGLNNFSYKFLPTSSLILQQSYSVVLASSKLT